MFPWLWLFAPQVHLPWSGSVAQHIAPDTHWFFSGIAPTAGDARIEEQAFAVASYGKQLGLITEVLLELAQQSPKASAAATESIAKLERIRDEIERIKGVEYARAADTLAEQVRAIQQRGGAKARALNARLQPLLGDNGRT
jgi:peptidoglycan hydrolase CwlO-like protein